MGRRPTIDPKLDSLKSYLGLSSYKTDHDKRMGAEKNSAGTRSGPKNVYFRRMSSGEPPLVAMDLYSHLH